MRRAFTRAISPAIARCELTHLARVPIDMPVAGAQHAAYEAALASLGCRVERLPDLPEHPDSVFVEDCAVVLDEIAVITRPGASARRGETKSVAEALAGHRTLVHIEAPHTLDGGDVLLLDRTLHVGLSTRSSAEAVAHLDALVTPHGYRAQGIEIRGCLHLKSAATRIAERLLLVNPEWVDPDRFPDHATVAVDPGEPQGANALRIGDSVILSAEHPRTRARLEAAGLSTMPLEMSELAKAEGAVTCCSLIVEG